MTNTKKRMQNFRLGVQGLLQWLPRARHRHFSIQKDARERPLCALDLHFCRAWTGTSSAADFYPTVKAALRHESVDSEEDREGLGCDLGQGQRR